MPLTITRNVLTSRVVRRNVTNNAPRRINISNQLSQVAQEGGLISRVFNFGRRLAGFVSAIFRGIGFSLTAIFGWLVQGATAIYQFNWNASDRDLRQTIQNQNISIASAWGTVVGGSLGWLSGIGIGYGIAYICPVIGGAALAKSIAGNVALEGLQEIGGTLRGAIQQTAAATASNLLISGYMQLRRNLKRVPESTLRRFFGERGARFIRETWGNEGGPTMSLSGAVEDRLESISNPLVRAFAESAYEEFWDSFVEAGYIVAAELDAAIEQARAGSSNALGPTRTVMLTPDRNASEEKIALTGDEKLVKQALQTTIAQHRLIHNRDIGQIVGQPVEDWYKARPQRRKLVIVFRDRPSPPWRHADGRRCQEATYSIPDARNGLTWREIKLVCDPYIWGRFRCTANLNNGRQMAVYGSSPDVAERKLRKLMTLSTAEVLTLSITEEKDRNPNLRKNPVQMYPSFFTLLVRRPAVGLTGRTDLDGTRWEEEHARVNLYEDEAPANMPVLR